jgi:hypothetical protein
MLCHASDVMSSNGRHSVRAFTCAVVLEMFTTPEYEIFMYMISSYRLHRHTYITIEYMYIPKQVVGRLPGTR